MKKSDCHREQQNLQAKMKCHKGVFWLFVLSSFLNLNKLWPANCRLNFVPSQCFFSLKFWRIPRIISTWKTSHWFFLSWANFFLPLFFGVMVYISLLQKNGGKKYTFRFLVFLVDFDCNSYFFVMCACFFEQLSRKTSKLKINGTKIENWRLNQDVSQF